MRENKKLQKSMTTPFKENLSYLTSKPPKLNFFRRIMLVVLICGMVLYVLGTFLRLAYPGVEIINTLAIILLVLSLPYAVYRLYIFSRDRLFYKVRTRIIVFYFFAGVIPIILVLVICLLAVYLFLGNLSLFIYKNELNNLSYRLHLLNAGIMEKLYNSPDHRRDPQFLNEQFQTILSSRAPDLQKVTIMFYQIDDGGGMRYIAVESSLQHNDFLGEHLPDWLQEIPYSGTVIKNYSVFSYSHNPIVLKGERFYLDLFIPFEKELFDYLMASSNLNSDIWVKERVIENGKEETIPYQPFNGFRYAKPIRKNLLTENTGRLVSKAAGGEGYTIDIIDTIDVLDWYRHELISAGTSGKSVVVRLSIPLSTIVDYLSSNNPTGKQYFNALVFFVYSFMVIEAISFVIGFIIIRSATRSVYQLSKGTQELRKGNLHVNIPAKHNDELGVLSRSFNTMALSIRNLLKEVSDKQRIMRELEIARQVQQEFFPRLVPPLRGFSLAGRCLPAREVSGDFYDFIPRSESVLDILVGDISGKGISAALLMASLQSACRAQPPMDPSRCGGNAGQIQLASLMGVLNRHLFSITPPEKFATIFYARICSESEEFYFCNAGHETPILIRANGQVTRLDIGGTVVGAFPDFKYEIGILKMDPGDLLAIFTDGLVEALSRAGEQFGEERLLSALKSVQQQDPQNILEYVYDEVTQWFAGVPQHDDITLVVFKRNDHPL